jgi:hypothetical protein
MDCPPVGQDRLAWACIAIEGSRMRGHHRPRPNCEDHRADGARRTTGRPNGSKSRSNLCPLPPLPHSTGPAIPRGEWE